jgi:hypothetical protein
MRCFFVIPSEARDLLFPACGGKQIPRSEDFARNDKRSLRGGGSSLASLLPCIVASSFGRRADQFSTATEPLALRLGGACDI